MSWHLTGAPEESHEYFSQDIQVPMRGLNRGPRMQVSSATAEPVSLVKKPLALQYKARYWSRNIRGGHSVFRPVSQTAQPMVPHLLTSAWQKGFWLMLPANTTTARLRGKEVQGEEQTFYLRTCRETKHTCNKTRWQTLCLRRNNRQQTGDSHRKGGVDEEDDDDGNDDDTVTSHNPVQINSGR